MSRKDHPLYATWRGMRQRCMNPNDPAYRNYGGRGVFICEEWNDFWQFVEDMGPKPTPQHSLDKDMIKPGNLIYCKEFCCWATKQEQSANRRGCKPKVGKYISKSSDNIRWMVKISVEPRLKTRVYCKTLEEAEMTRDHLLYERDFYRFVGLY